MGTQWYFLVVIFIQVLVGDIGEASRTFYNYLHIWKQFGATPEFFSLTESKVIRGREGYPLRPGNFLNLSEVTNVLIISESLYLSFKDLPQWNQHGQYNWSFPKGTHNSIWFKSILFIAFASKKWNALELPLFTSSYFCYTFWE